MHYIRFLLTCVLVIGFSRASAMEVVADFPASTDPWVTARQETVWAKNGDRVRGISFVGEGSLAVAVTKKGWLAWFETATPSRLIAELQTGLNDVTAFAIDKSGRYIAIGGETGVKIYDSQTLSLFHTFRFSEPISSVAFSADNKLIVGGARGRIWIYRYLVKEKLIEVFHVRNSASFELSEIAAVRIIDDGCSFVSVQGNRLKVWDMASGNVLRENHIGDCMIPTQAQFIDDDRLLCIYSNGTCIVVSLLNGDQKIRRIVSADGSPMSLLSLKPSRSEDYVIAGDMRGTVCLWKRASQDSGGYRKICSFLGTGFMTQLAFRADQMGFLAGNNRGKLVFCTVDSESAGACRMQKSSLVVGSTGGQETDEVK